MTHILNPPIARRKFLQTAALTAAAAGLGGRLSAFSREEPLYLYRLTQKEGVARYDEAVAVACLQGILNRRTPRVYVSADGDPWPDYWLSLFGRDGGWAARRAQIHLESLDALFALAAPQIRGAVVWDEQVPASLNVATTMAGVEDAVVLSPELAAKYLSRWKLPVRRDLRGMFTGEKTGSRKNDAYRWALSEYLLPGRCAAHWLCLYEDAFSTRAAGNLDYVVTRDWAVTHRAFVFDLSPWGDEAPGDDPSQPLGTDLETYRQILRAQLAKTAGRQMTELSGFFAFSKYSHVAGHASSHEPVPTEWETVYLISPYNCYQNTVAGSCYNQSFHSHAPFRRLNQKRPAFRALAPATYIAILMADYDSATPLYRFMPQHWKDPARGQIPLTWGLDPNLVETYPDIITHLYKTATDQDFFAADASAAGYMNPDRIAPEYLPLFIDHNRRFYHALDMTISPMVLDWDEPTPAVKDAFREFSPDGFATIVMDLHGHGGKGPEPQVWKGMPVTNLNNSTCNFSSPEETARIMSGVIGAHPQEISFHFFRIVWTDPGKVIEAISLLRRLRPELHLEVTDPYNFFHLFSLCHATHG